MDIQKCEALLSSIDSGSFSKAADRLGYTASAVTKMVNALENEIGFPLVSRNNKGIIPTENGKKLMPIMRRMIKDNETASQMSAEMRGLVRGSITIGSYYSIAAFWLPKVISSFQKDYPGITITTLEGYNRELIANLESRKIDCCFFAENPSFHGDWIPIKDDELVVWLPKDHPKANREEYPVKDLATDPFIYTSPGQDTDLDRLLKQEKIKPNVRFSTADAFTTYSMVAEGLGVSFNNKLVTKNWKGNVVTRSFQPKHFVTLGIAVPSLVDASPAAKRFIKYAKDILTQGGAIED